MKRAAIAIASVLVLVLVSAAFAAIRVKHFEGNTDDELCGANSQVTCEVSFETTYRNKRAVEVDNLGFAGIPLECDQGTIVAQSLEGLEIDFVPVNRKRKFHGYMTGEPEATLTVKGRFSKNYKTVRGTLVNTLNDPPRATNCTTGTDNFTATR